MYKIRSNFTKKLKNKVINEISFGLNVIVLRFVGGGIQFSGSFSIEINNQINNYNEVYPVRNDYHLLKVLEKKIISVSINENLNSLSFCFEENIKLILYSNDNYESFRIFNDGNEIVI